MASRIKFTRKVKRGLVLARGLLIDSFDPDTFTSAAQVRKWTKAQQREFNAAMAWLEQVESDLAPAQPEAVAA